jgi:hypothetical protein
MEKMRWILDCSSGSWTAFPPLDLGPLDHQLYGEIVSPAAMEQDGRPEVEASMRWHRKGNEACSVASGEGSKVRRHRGLEGVGGDDRRGLFLDEGDGWLAVE